MMQISWENCYENFNIDPMGEKFTKSVKRKLMSDKPENKSRDMGPQTE